MRVARCSVLVAAFTVALLVPAPAVFAQVPADTAVTSPDAATPVAHEPAVFVVANRPVFVFRGRSYGYPPERRLEAATERLHEAIGEGGPGVVTTSETELGWLLQVDGRLIFVITPGDADPLRGLSLEHLVEGTRRNMQEALGAFREQRSVDRLVSAILRALLATVIMVRAVQYLRRLVRWLTGWLERYTARRMARLEGQVTITQQAVALVRLVLRALGIALGIVLVYSWLAYVLNQFPYTSPWGDQLGSYLQNTGATVLWAILHSIPGLLMVVIIFMLARLVSRWVRLLFMAARDGRLDLPGVDADTALPTQRLITIFIWALAIALAFPFIPGSGGPAFQGISVLLGLMVSLGASSVVGQAASGYILMYSRSLRLGDYVRINDYEGTVISMSMLSTKVRTPRDEEINIPNSVIVNSISKNYSRLTQDTGAVLPTTVTIGYSTPWRQVHAMLAEAARRTAGVRQGGKSRVLQSALSDFFVEYTLLVRLDRPDGRALVSSALHANIQDVFNEHGVQIMSPHYEADPAAKVWVPKDRWHEPPADRGDV